MAQEDSTNIGFSKIMEPDKKSLLSLIEALAKQHPVIGQTLKTLKGLYFAPAGKYAGSYSPEEDFITIHTPMEGTILHELKHAAFERNPELRRFGQLLFEEMPKGKQKDLKEQGWHRGYHGVYSEALASGFRPNIEESDFSSWSNYMLSDLKTSLDKLLLQFPGSRKYINRIGAPRISTFNEGR